jgi:hypothetical protein
LGGIVAKNVAIFRNVMLTDPQTGGRTSSVGEPSVANNGKHILYSGNWFAAQSSDNAATWTQIDPFSFFPPADGGFCCDQTVHYDSSRDLTIWLLQYIKQNNTNTLRIAVKTGPLDVAGGWRRWDLKPQQVNPAWAGEWFDYNHAALSNNFLYVGTNAFRVSDNQWTRCVIFRIPLDMLATTAALTFETFVSTQNFSLRCVQGATTTMYFASHNSTRQIRLFAWPENSTSVTSRDINIKPWVAGSMSAPVGNANWLARCDSRITGAWIGDGLVGFMWTANQQTADRPRPFVRVVRISLPSQTLLDEPDIWNDQVAYAYPEAAANMQGIPGITVFSGGGVQHPALLVGFWDDDGGAWRTATAGQSTHSPADNKWGDYLTCRRHSPDGLGWVATGYTLDGGGARQDIVPRYVHFGIDAHQAAGARWANS